MIVDIPAYDSAFFIKNGLVWGTFRGKITRVFPNQVTSNYLYTPKLVLRKYVPIFPREVFTNFIMPKKLFNQKVSKIFPDSAVYTRTQWQKIFSMAQSISQSTEANNLDATYSSTVPFNALATAIDYVAQDNPIVDILVTTISLKEPDYTFVPVGGHVG